MKATGRGVNGGSKGKGAAQPLATEGEASSAAVPTGAKPMLEKMPKPQAHALKGKYVEIFWDGEAAWFEAEVLRYDETTRSHLVRYTADGWVCEELLSGPKGTHKDAPDLSVWRACIKTTARGAAAKAASNAAAKAAAGLPDAEAPLD
jgi:hypothetical protein